MIFNALRYIKRIKTTGAVAESSVSVIKNITNNICSETSQVVVELGAGTGNVTAQILKKMHPDSVLYCFEINADFIKDLADIQDKRFRLVRHSALDLLEFVDEQSVDVIISTLPLTLFKFDEREKLLRDSYRALKQDGVFRQFLYSYKKFFFSELFSQINISVAVLNLPPAVIYSCSK